MRFLSIRIITLHYSHASMIKMSVPDHSGCRYLTYPEEPVNQNKLFLQSLSNMQDVSLACIYIILNMMRVDLNNNNRYREREAFIRSKPKSV